jgi:hypothetical protein
MQSSHLSPLQKVILLLLTVTLEKGNMCDEFEVLSRLKSSGLNCSALRTSKNEPISDGMWQTQHESSVAALAVLLLPDEDLSERCLMFGAADYFSAFFDASGVEHQGRVLVVGGYIASFEQWGKFESEWNEVLKEFGVPSYFRMAEFAHSTGQFSGWRDKEDRRRAFLKKLTTVIRIRVRRSIGLALLLDDYNAVNADFELSERLGHPFPLAGVTCVNIVAAWAERASIKTPILYTFEKGDSHRGELIEQLDNHFHVLPNFGNKTQYNPLQAADFVAWELRKLAVDYLAVKDEPPEVKLIQRWTYEELEKVPHDHQVLTKAGIEGLCEDFKIPRRLN